jgi:predicted RNA binding protein YcfA (HicA-like mRNA interferase family)
MARLKPVSRRELIQRLKKLDFEGPYTGGRHEFMLRRSQRLILPNPHRGDISAVLLARLLRQAGVSPEAWEETRR